MPHLNDATRGRLLYGGDYNPEQWPEEVWAEDMALMRRAGVNTATVGVFSWARYEPRPGLRDFSWLDRVLDLLQGNGISAILATPTASPPPWLGHLHRDTLPVMADGVVLGYGSRNQYCPSSPVYRERADAIVEDLAARYAHHPAVVMWHVGNEPGPWCWCRNCEFGFRRWLRERYGEGDDGLAALNHAWGTAFWSQHYGAWPEIKPPRAAPYMLNPAQVLDYSRYQSDALVACFDAEAAILRRHNPELPITTNLIPDFFAVDQWDLRGRFDFASVDSYPDPALGPEAGADHAYAADLARSLSGGRPWVLMEQSPSEVNWRPVNKHKQPGRMRLFSLQAITRGADASLFFQWRQASAGAERFHAGMLPNAGPDTRGFREITEHGRELADRDDLRKLVGTTVTARAAIVLDWPSRWALGGRGQPSERVDYSRIVKQWHASLWRQNIAVDFVRIGDDLGGYALVLAPALHVLSTADAEHLAGYAADGGCLVAGYLTGTVDETTRLHPGGYQAAALREALGVFVEELHPLDDGETEPCQSSELGAFDAVDWTELAHPRGAQVVAELKDGRAAVTRNAHGRGTAWYVAVQPSLDGLDRILAAAAFGAGVAPVVAGLPAGVEAVRRGTTLVLLNHNAEAVSIDLGADAAGGLAADPAASAAFASASAGLELPGYGVLLRDSAADSPQ
ncbi:beta-galactosidase [Catenulispora sp. EB89]|uniref:beta-galactosidase n=1 Tax=Catenulispora sp. EB89 TaxID=3156257 RepID=UPI003516F18C